MSDNKVTVATDRQVTEVKGNNIHEVNTWSSGMGPWMRFYLQAGFAGVVAIVFVIGYLHQMSQISNMHEDGREDSRLLRADFRDELKLERETARETRQEFWRALRELKASIDDLRWELAVKKKSTGWWGTNASVFDKKD